MKEDERRYLQSHRAHDYRDLRRRWKAIARAAKLTERVMHKAGGFDVVGYRSRGRSPEEALYLCAGVHGDEPAGVLGLVEWAEENVDLLAETPVAILPCFNPWGLINNTRNDHRGKDLNRLFHSRRDGHIVNWRKYLDGGRFRLCVTLHEDYDAKGLYLYEVARSGLDLGEKLLRGCRAHIAPDPRKTIDGMRPVNGVIRRRTKRIPKDLSGLPEALVLFYEHSDHSITFETPSEYSLFRRVGAQKAFLDGVFRLGGG